MAKAPTIDPSRRWLPRLARLRHLFLVALAAVMVVSTLILRSYENPPWARVLIALMPLVPTAAIVATYTVLIRKGCYDELGRRVLLEGCATVFIAGMPLLLLYGMLRNADVGLPALDWPAIFIVSSVLWGLGVVVSLRRHQGYINWTSGGSGGRGAGGEP